MNIDRIINIVRKLNEEMMTTGAGGGAGFAGTGPDDNGSPTAGYDKPLDGLSLIHISEPTRPY